MDRNVENLIQTFVDKYDIVDRSEIVHGTLYVKFTEEKECDFFHKALRTFFRKLDPTGGVNMYAVGDEFAFDFVPEDREAPVFVEPYAGEPTDIDDQIKGVWSEFAEEEILNNMPDEVDTEMQLEIEQMKGK
jgi:hypothetical protein